jgi:Holliday junction resolvase
MAQGESKLSRRIAAALTEQGAFAFKIHGSAYMMAGLPDIICCFQGRFYSFETKMPKTGKTSAIQTFIHQKIRDAGGVAEVVTSVDEALKVLHGLRREE